MTPITDSTTRLESNVPNSILKMVKMIIDLGLSISEISSNKKLYSSLCKQQVSKIKKRPCGSNSRSRDQNQVFEN